MPEKLGLSPKGTIKRFSLLFLYFLCPKYSNTMTPQVGIIMGSDSDLGVMQAAADILKEFDISFECKAPDSGEFWCCTNAVLFGNEG